MELPLFPLQTVLYPGLPLPLHIFEERYRRMFGAVLDADRRFGVVAIVKGMEAGGSATYHPVGCAAEVGDVRRHPDGRLDLVARGLGRFRIDGVSQSSPYIVAEVTTLDEPAGDQAERRALTAARLFTRYVATLLRLSGQPADPVDVPDDPVAASYLVAAGLQVDLGDKQRLLEAPSATDRLRLEALVLRRELTLLERLRVAGPAPPSATFSAN